MRRLIVGGLGLLVVLILIKEIIMMSAYEAKEVAKEALVSSNEIEVEQKGLITFSPKQREGKKGIIIYPGGQVQHEAYAPLARELAEKGYLVSIVDMPLNFAILDVDKGLEVMATYPEIESWSIIGHSLGGVAAAEFAATQPKIEEVIFLAAYPGSEVLKETTKEVISIYGDLDGVINRKNLETSKDKLPESARYIEIKGANHAQFGDYGFQKGDQSAQITAEQQIDQTVESIITQLKND